MGPGPKCNLRTLPQSQNERSERIRLKGGYVGTMKPTAIERQKISPDGKPGGIESFIQQRAYELYLSRGQAPGREMEDWLQAEREIKARRPEPQRAQLSSSDVARER
jgi:hypothetical protein